MPDANPHPPDAFVRMCGSTPSVPAGTSGQLASDTFAIAWQALSGPPENVNPMLGANRVTIDVAKGTAHYDSTTCAECTFDHAGTDAGNGCLLMMAGNDGSPSHDAYYLCSTSSGVIAEITWCGYPGPPDARTWRMTGAVP